MDADHGKFSSGRSSITTNESTPDLLELLTSSSDSSLQNSTSSLSVNIYAEELPTCSHTYLNIWNRDDNYEEMNTNLKEKISSTEPSSNTEESTSYTTRNNTSTTETRLSTTDTTKTTDTFTSYSDNSDSAYTNSHSIFTQTIDSNLSYTSETQQSIYNEDNEQATEKNTNTKRRSEDSASSSNVRTDDFKTSAKSQNLNESSTQTPSTANLNVISNVQLSQSTLDVIFNHVLQDVNSKQPNSLNMNSLTANLPHDEKDENKQERQHNEEELSSDSKIINVQPVPSFYLNRKEEIVVTTEHSRVMKYMLSNVGAGSPYSKPAEIPQVIVPRFSALPRTSSMEVNTSSVDSTDRESDTISLADSLEDGVSPRGNHNVLAREDDRPKHDDLSVLLPDNSDARRVKSPQKSAAFFIPIESKQKEDFKPVSYHLPAKVKEKLSRRQFRREQKIRHTKAATRLQDLIVII